MTSLSHEIFVDTKTINFHIVTYKYFPLRFRKYCLYAFEENHNFVAKPNSRVMKTSCSYVRVSFADRIWKYENQAAPFIFSCLSDSIFADRIHK